MRQQIVFSHKQNLFILGAIKHLPLNFHKSKSGLFQDPVTKQNIAGVFYFDSNWLVAIFIRFIIWILSDKESKENESKCVRYGYIIKT